MKGDLSKVPILMIYGISANVTYSQYISISGLKIN
jgi:hypothetical protein